MVAVQNKITNTPMMKWAVMRQKLSSGFVTRFSSIQPAQLERLARKLKCSNFNYHTL